MAAVLLNAELDLKPFKKFPRSFKKD